MKHKKFWFFVYLLGSLQQPYSPKLQFITNIKLIAHPYLRQKSDNNSERVLTLPINRLGRKVPNYDHIKLIFFLHFVMSVTYIALIRK